MLLAALLPLPGLASPLPPVRDLAGVYEAVAFCGSLPAGISIVPHADRQKVLDTRRIELSDLGYAFAIPQIAESQHAAVSIIRNDTSRGVNDHYILMQRDGLTPDAAVVITELPEDSRSRERAFDSVRIMQGRNAERAGFALELTEVQGPFGEGLEMIIPRRAGSNCFPTAHYIFNEPDGGPATLGISRFAKDGDRLLEFTVIVYVPEGVDEEGANAHARAIMDGFWHALERTPGPEAGPG
ncbi:MULTISPECIES: hypothetical protein [unclassified Luteimonas]